MAEVTVALGGDGGIVFAVNWSEPMRTEFASRQEAEGFAVWLRAVGCTLEADGACAPCSAHHRSGHGCPSCGADLGLRVTPGRGVLLRPRPPTEVAPDRFLIAREQHHIRLALVAEAKAARKAELEQADLGVDHVMALTS